MANSTDWIELTDFSPGIFQDWHGASQLAPEGAAQLEGTYGCVGSPTGGLIPAPRCIAKFKDGSGLIFPVSGITLAEGTHQPDGFAKQFILSMKVVSPIVTGPGYAPDPDFPDAVSVIFGNLSDPSGAAGAGANSGCYFYARMMKIFADPSDTTPTTYTVTSHNNSTTATEFFNGTQIPYIGFAGQDVSRTNSATPASPGGVVVGYVLNGVQELGAATTVAYPSNAAPSIDGTTAMTFGTLTVQVTAIIAHQDRFIGLVQRMSGAALKDRFATGYNANTEIIVYTDPNDYNTTTAPAAGVAFVNESPSGYGSWVSMNASELFLIKQKGGGVIIRGDIANPQVVRMPGITSTGEAINLGTLTPLGYLYGSDNGVWLWTGADMTQNISPQLEGWFWKTPYMDNIAGPKGSWAYATPFVFGPNNFLWDTRTSSWWRLENPDDVVLNWFDTNAAGHMVAAPMFTAPGNDNVLYYYDTQKGQSEFQFHSHPLMRGKQRMMTLEEVEVVLSGSGRVTLTYEDKDGNLTVPIVFEVDSKSPIHLNNNIGTKVYDPVLWIKSEAYDENDPAPRVLSVRTGVNAAEGY